MTNTEYIFTGAHDQYTPMRQELKIRTNSGHQITTFSTPVWRGFLGLDNLDKLGQNKLSRVLRLRASLKLKVARILIFLKPHQPRKG
jgi:hypothetical protein